MPTNLIVFEAPWDDNFHAFDQMTVKPHFEGLVRNIDGIKLYYERFFNLASLQYGLQVAFNNIHDGQCIIYIAGHGQNGAFGGGAANINVGPFVNYMTGLFNNNFHLYGLMFGCCNIGNNDALSVLANGQGSANWVHAYTPSVDWLPSTLLDMSIVSNMVKAANHDGGAVMNAAGILNHYCDGLEVFNGNLILNQADVNDNNGKVDPVSMRDSFRIWVGPMGAALAQDRSADALAILDQRKVNFNNDNELQPNVAANQW